jgi:dTDP-4-dehydrorhamnose reductase
LTTIAFADLIANVLTLQKTLAGLYQVASEAISKYELLCLMRDAYRINTVVEPFDEINIDRSLDGTRFRTATGLTIPGWPEMIRAMAADPTPYDQWRSQRVS